MKKILFITALFFTFNFVKPQSTAQNLTAQQSQGVSSLRLFRDITVWFNGDKATYHTTASVDLNGKYNLMVSLGLTANHSIKKYDYTLDENGKTTRLITYNWNSTTQAHVESTKEEYTYDTTGNQTLYIKYDWNSTTNAFVPPASASVTLVPIKKVPALTL